MSAAPGSTLVVVPNWVGDTVMALPVLEALAASGRELHALARPHLVPLLREAAAIAGTIERDDDDRRTVEALAAAGCGEAVILPNSFRSAWLPRRAGIARRWGYRGGLRGPLLDPGVRRPRGAGRHQTEDYRELLEAMGVAAPESWVPRLALSAEARRLGAESLTRAGVPASGGPLVGLFPGAEFGPSKRWPWKNFAELARRLRKELPAGRYLLVAGPREVDLAVKIHFEAAKALPVIGTDLDLAALAGLLERLDLLVTNDSGPMHLAAAVGTRCLALFGPTDPRRTRPAGEAHGLLYTDRWCSPCFRRRCPLLHHRCLKDIEPGRALAEAVALLAGSGGDPA